MTALLYTKTTVDSPAVLQDSSAADTADQAMVFHVAADIVGISGVATIGINKKSAYPNVLLHNLHLKKI